MHCCNMASQMPVGNPKQGRISYSREVGGLAHHSMKSVLRGNRGVLSGSNLLSTSFTHQSSMKRVCMNQLSGTYN